MILAQQIQENLSKLTDSLSASYDELCELIQDFEEQEEIAEEYGDVYDALYTMREAVHALSDGMSDLGL